MATSAGKADNVASVLKVLSVFETLSEERNAALATLAHKAMTSKSTTHRLLQTMVEMGYVEQDPETERYSLTLKLFGIAVRALNAESDLLRVADRGMGRLSRATGESINLGVIDEHDNRVVYVHARPSAFNLSTKSTIGMRNPLHSTSLGKALLAFRPDDEVEERIARMDFVASAPNTIVDADRLRDALALTRRNGYAEEVEESEAGVRCMAVPVLDHLGKSMAAISISFPLFRFETARHDDYAGLLLDVGRETSREMGYDPSP